MWMHYRSVTRSNATKLTRKDGPIATYAGRLRSDQQRAVAMNLIRFWLQQIVVHNPSVDRVAIGKQQKTMVTPLRGPFRNLAKDWVSWNRVGNED